jgi:GT2 family glycosyltransferase
VNSNKIITASLVLYHNSDFDILKVLNSIINSNIYIKLYVVDNSNDDYIKELLVDFDIYYIKNNKNLGFGKAHNIAIKIAVASNSDYHIIINPDISFESNVVGELIKRAEKDKEIGLIMPKIIYPNGDVQFLCKLLPNPIVLIFRRFLPFKVISNRMNQNYELKSMDLSKESEIPSLSGCFMFIRTAFLNNVGGFDERYFMYLEDIDLCRKLGKISKLIYFPKVTVVHNYEKGSYKSKKLLIFHIKSSIKYFNKWGWLFDRKRIEINKNAKKKLLVKK